jgi:alkylation response protein AidB-like acyl-CoA dehydrogenase
VERNYRDARWVSGSGRALGGARITEIYEGTSEIQCLVIAGHMQKEFRTARQNES